MLKLKHTLAGLALALAVGFVGQAHATLITGQISIGGNDSFTSTALGDPISSVTFSGPANVGGVPTGSYASFVDCTGCVTMTSTTLSTSTVLPLLIYTITEGPLTTTMTLNTDSFLTVPSNTLTITGTGSATETGFDPTPITWTFTTQDPAGTFTFSATTHAVPEPASLAIFGTALAGLGVIRRRRRKAA